MMAVGLLLLVVGLLGLVFWYGPVRAPARGGISRLEQVKLGGVPQWISIRGADPGAPVLLFLHGGPGSANLAKIRLQVPELEQHFVVVNWDAHELVAYLKVRFGVEKIYLMGFSWGTVIGLSLAARYPQDLYAYIAVSQIVQPAEGERLSLERVRQAAQQAGNTAASAELDVIDPAYRRPDWFQQISTERKWLLQLGGVYHTTTSYSHEIWMMLKAREYSLAEFALWPGRSSASLKALWGQVMGVNFFESTPALGCPVYFFVGRYDDNVPGQLTAAYYAQLAAPAGKHLVWFENSAHDLFFDEPGPVVRETLNALDARK
jgi:proline iminopeptidase